MKKSLKELTEEWNREHPEQAINLTLALFDLTDKQPRIKCPACNAEMIWTKDGRSVFCHKCHTWIHFSDEGLEEIHKKQNR